MSEWAATATTGTGASLNQLKKIKLPDKMDSSGWAAQKWTLPNY